MNIPDYILLHCCGRGAYGEVWLAKDRTGRSVALKYLANSIASEKELTGLKNYAKLPDSPHLIRIFHIGETNDGIFYTMELADCLYQDGHYAPVTLAYKLQMRKRFTPVETVRLGIAVTDGLIQLHQAGLLHRDIKPENILYVKGIPKLSDVGLVRSLKQTLSVGGTLGFIPPERLIPGKDSVSGSRGSDDVYALGKVLYCALTGNKVEDFPSFPPELMLDCTSRELNKIILKACGPVSSRFPDPESFRMALEKAIHPASSGKRPALICFVLAVLFFIFVAGTFYFFRHPSNAVKETAQDSEKLMEAKKEIERKNAEIIANGERNRDRLMRLFKYLPRTTLGKVKNKMIEDMISSHFSDPDLNDMREEVELIKKVLAQPVADGKKKQKLEETLGGLECVPVIDLKVLKDGTILYTPKKNDAIHQGAGFDVLDNSTRMAKLVCSVKDSQSPEWDTSGTYRVPDPAIKDREGIYRLNKNLPDEYALQFDLETIKLNGSLVLHFRMKPQPTEVLPQTLIDISIYPEKATVRGVHYFLPNSLHGFWSDREQEFYYPKESFRVSIIRTNLQFRVYFDDCLMLHVPSYFPGGYFYYLSENPGCWSLKDLKIYDIRESGKLETLKPEEQFHLP